MDGVTILNQIEVNSGSPFSVIIIIMAFVLIVISILAICLIIEEKDYGVLYAPIGGIVVAIIILIMEIFNISEPPRTNYEVTISDEVSFTDFTNKYEIIEQRGEIYVVREREEGLEQ